MKTHKLLYANPHDHVHRFHCYSKKKIYVQLKKLSLIMDFHRLTQCTCITKQNEDLQNQVMTIGCIWCKTNTYTVHVRHDDMNHP